jgi:hypothetical protein
VLVKGIEIKRLDKPWLIVVDIVLIPMATLIAERLAGKNELIELRPGPSEIVDKEKETVLRSELVPGVVRLVLSTLPRSTL